MLNGNIIWSKVGKADSDNARRQYMVALVEDQCVPFPLLLHESNGVTGYVWL